MNRVNDGQQKWTFRGLQVPESNTVHDLTESDLAVVFQPIVDLTSGTTFSHEALTRCAHPRFYSPAVLFEQAAREQACGRLGRLVRNVLFEHCDGCSIFINLHPQEMSQRWLVQPTDPLFIHDAPLHLEVTETAAFKNFDICMSVLGELRARADAKVVVDDFGVGFSDYKRVEQLRPDLVKLDMSLIRGLHKSPKQQQRVREIIRRCGDVGAKVVAEGIETEQELAACVGSGADYGQGYLLGRPTSSLKPALWPKNVALASSAQAGSKAIVSSEDAKSARESKR